jgi:hypothetical protein
MLPSSKPKIGTKNLFVDEWSRVDWTKEQKLCDVMYEIWRRTGGINFCFLASPIVDHI